MVVMTHEVAFALAEKVIEKALGNEYQSNYSSLKEVSIKYDEEYHAVFTVFVSTIHLHICKRNNSEPEYSEYLMYDRETKRIEKETANGYLFRPLFNRILLLDSMGQLTYMLGL